MMLMPTASIDSLVLSLRRGRSVFVLLGIFLMVMLMLIDQIFITSEEQDISLSPIEHRQLSVNNKKRQKNRLKSRISSGDSIEIQNDHTNHTKTTIKVYLFDGLKPAHSYSIFKTDTLSRYGSHFEYQIVEQFSRDICHEDAPGSVHDSNMDGTPCLIPPYSSTSYCSAMQLKRIYPTCKIVLAGDERCRVKDGYDIRQYYTTSIPNDKVYIPLGPRYDTWASFKKLREASSSSVPNNFVLKPPSMRTYAFNAIFSQSTSTERIKLANIIRENKRHASSPLPIFERMAKQWTSDVNALDTQQLNTDRYVEILLDSIFTLSPVGHNPECYRLYEAIEMGSIPIIVKSPSNHTATPRQHHPCKDALKPWHDAPIVVLQSWEDLYPTVETLIQDLDSLDSMQTHLRTWYDNHMRTIVGNFEKYMLKSMKEGEEVDEKEPAIVSTILASS